MTYMERDMIQNKRPECVPVAEILWEEERFFLRCHHREPIGREREDVVDNAWSRLSVNPVKGLSYIDVANMYDEMRCAHAGS